MKYIGVKVVEATSMNQVDALVEGYRTGDCTEQQGYEVTYEDGYKSWSPKSVFDKAYKSTQGATFGLAIEAMKKGFRVARSGWNGKGMWLQLIPETDYLIGRDSGELKMYKDVGLLPWIGMKTADNKFVPWLASQTDMLAEDWIVK